MAKSPAPRNRTITLSPEELATFTERLMAVDALTSATDLTNRTIHQDLFEALPHLPDDFIDLVIADPPYNMAKNFNGKAWNKVPLEEYEAWLETWVLEMKRVLKPTGSIYVCGDWQSSTAIHRVLDRHFVIQNRITWEREKGRGAKTNWKNSSEDIWFATMHKKDYVFNVDAVKLKRKVIAPYRDNKGQPKDWQEHDGGNFRLTHPSNLWTDLSVPFWSMPENTPHPTQKPEKLIAKMILASSKPGGLVFDPFLGSGTTSVTAKKLGRCYLGIELNEEFACFAEKRLAMADTELVIQGYRDGVFYERNSTPITKKKPSQGELFDFLN